MRRLLRPRWVLVHAGAVILVAGFLGLGWWQLDRAAGGNLLSYGYAIEWPAFAAFVIWVWVKEMRRALREVQAPSPVRVWSVPEPAPGRGPRATRQAPRTGPAYDDSDDPELAAYNDFLRWRNANPYAAPADYPGPSREAAIKPAPTAKAAEQPPTAKAATKQPPTAKAATKQPPAAKAATKQPPAAKAATKQTDVKEMSQ